MAGASPVSLVVSPLSLQGVASHDELFPQQSSAPPFARSSRSSCLALARESASPIQILMAAGTKLPTATSTPAGMKELIAEELGNIRPGMGDAQIDHLCGRAAQVALAETRHLGDDEVGKVLADALRPILTTGGQAGMRGVLRTISGHDCTQDRTVRLLVALAKLAIEQGWFVEFLGSFLKTCGNDRGLVIQLAKDLRPADEDLAFLVVRRYAKALMLNGLRDTQDAQARAPVLAEAVRCFAEFGERGLALVEPAVSVLQYLDVSSDDIRALFLAHLRASGPGAGFCLLDVEDALNIGSSSATSEDGKAASPRVAQLVALAAQQASFEEAMSKGLAAEPEDPEGAIRKVVQGELRRLQRSNSPKEDYALSVRHLVFAGPHACAGIAGAPDVNRIVLDQVLGDESFPEDARLLAIVSAIDNSKLVDAATRNCYASEVGRALAHDPALLGRITHALARMGMGQLALIVIQAAAKAGEKK